jgi:hypothetical protein
MSFSPIRQRWTKSKIRTYAGQGLQGFDCLLYWQLFKVDYPPKAMQGKGYRILRVDYLGQRVFPRPLCQLSHAPRYTAWQCTALHCHAAKERFINTPEC